MDPRELSEAGLTAGEARVYLALIRLGPTKSGRLSAMAGVSSSKVYKILDRLEKKGLAGHVTRGKVKFFSALSAKRLLDMMDKKASELEEKRKHVESMLPSLEIERAGAAEKPDAVVYDGFKAVTNYFTGMLDELSRGETYYVIGASYGENVPGLRDFFYAYHKRRCLRGIRVRMLANHDVKEVLVKTTRRLSEIRYLPPYLVTNMQIVFYRDKVFIPLWIREPKGFLIESREAAESFRAYFEAFWKRAKP